MGLPGTITLSPETFEAVITDTDRLLIRHGFKKRIERHFGYALERCQPQGLRPVSRPASLEPETLLAGPAGRGAAKRLEWPPTQLDSFAAASAVQDVYAHMMAAGEAARREMPAHASALLREGDGEAAIATFDWRSDCRGAHVGAPVHAAELSQVPLQPEEWLARPDLFPDGCLDEDLQQIDLRRHNSWRMLLADVPTVELPEVQLVNAIAPFLFDARLDPLLLRAPGRDQHIVNCW